MNYAIIEIGGKQFWVEKKKYCVINRLPLKLGTNFFLKRVLLINQDKKIEIGYPYINTAKIEAVVLNHFEGKKIIVYKMKPKKKYRRKNGYRPKLTKILINNINF